MATAKNSFIERINIFNNIIYPENSTDLDLNSRALTETLHNEKVRMLRNGMTIIGFTILEDFIKKRTGEVLKEISSTNCSFNCLPDKLKDAVTFYALKGISSRAESLKRSSGDYISFIQNETEFVSSTKRSVYEFSEYSMGWDKSNLNSNDISEFLNTFNVKSGWDSIQRLSSIINCSLLNPSQIFSNFATNRHKSAHNSNADTLLTDLQSFILQSKVLAFCFDALLNKSLSYIRQNNTGFLSGGIKTLPEDIKIRYIIESRGQWKEYQSNNSNRAFRANIDYTQILGEAKLRAERQKEVLLVKHENNSIREWFTYQ